MRKQQTSTIPSQKLFFCNQQPNSLQDAHNHIIDFDTKTSLFAVYDGHGGAEVAKYCALKLPQFIKDLQAYKDGDFNKALEEAFLGFDASISTPEIIELLKGLSGKFTVHFELMQTYETEKEPAR